DRLLYVCASGRSFPLSDGRREHRLDDVGLKALGGARQEDLALLVVLVDHPGVGARELDRPADDRREDGVEIERGADRAPDIAEGGELLDRAGELLGPRL